MVSARFRKCALTNGVAMSQNGAKLFSEPEAEVMESESIGSDSLATCTVNPVQF